MPMVLLPTSRPSSLASRARSGGKSSMSVIEAWVTGQGGAAPQRGCQLTGLSLCPSLEPPRHPNARHAMQITWFGHSCFRIDTGKSRILIDPFLTGNPTFEDSGLTVREVAKGVTHVALTHGHEDHTRDTVAICKETTVPLIAVYELAVHMASLGVEKIDPGNTGGTQSHADFDLTFVPAWHSSGVFHEGRSIYLGACCGLVIAGREGKTVY